MLAKHKLNAGVDHLAPHNEPGYRVFWNVCRGDLQADILKRLHSYAGGYNSPSNALRKVNELLEMADHIIGEDNKELYGTWCIVVESTNSVFKSGTIRSKPAFQEVS